MSESIRKLILLVEDEALIAMTEKMLLEEYGYDVRTVTTGEKAVEAVKTSSDIDLILMDINLGDGIDGTQAAEIILKDHDVPIVFLSSHTNPEVVEKTEKITSYGYVVKNSSITVLDASIKMAFRLFDTNRSLKDELVGRKQAEEKIQEQDIRMRKLFANVPDLIYQFTRRPDGSYYVPIASNGVRNIFGCSPEDVRHSFEPISNVIYPEDAGRVIEEIEYSAKHLTYFTCEFRVHIPGRDIQWILSRSTPEKFPDGSITWYGFNADITDRKRAEEAIEEQRDFSESLIETAQAIILVLDTQGRIVQFNPYTEELLGYSLDEVKGMDWIETFIRPENGHNVKSVFRKAVTGTQTRGNVNSIVAKDGRTILVEWYDKPLKDANGHTIGVLATGINITERKQAETKLAENVKLLSRAQEIARIGHWQLDVTANRLSWSDEVYRIFGCEPQEFAATYEAFLDFVHPDDRAGVDDAYSRSLQEGSDGYEIEHRIVRRDSGEVRYVHERCDHERDDTGAVIQSTGMVQDITEQKQAEQELIRQKQYLETILETTSDGFWVVTPDKKIANVNAAYCRMSGYSTDELTRMEINDVDAIENPEETDARLKRIMENGSETFETKHRRKDGSVFDVEVSASRLDREDGMYLVCFCRDITQRRKTRQELEESRKQYQALVERSPDIIYLFGTKSGGIFWSKAAHRILGIEPQDIIRDPFLWNRSIHPEDRPMVETAIAGAINGEPFDIEYRIQAKDGSWVWLRDRMINRTQEDGEIIIQGHAEDITEQKYRKDALEKERHRLSAILDGTNVGTWEWNVQTGETRFNERWATMIGYTLEEISPVSIETWEHFSHPEDLERSAEALQAHFAGKTDYYETEARMRHKDGHWVWVLDRGKVTTWTEDGNPEWVFGTHQDINARKRQEEKRLALANAASALQASSAESIDYAGIAETAKQLSGATFAALNTFGPSQQNFTTRAIAGVSEHIQKASKLLGFPVVGRTWNYDPHREAAIGDSRTTVLPSLGSLASGSFSASIANRIARTFHVGEVVIVRIATAADIQGDFTLLFSNDSHLQDQDLVETYSSMVGITLERIQTEQQNTKLVADKETLLREAHHRIKNNMNTMTSLLSLHANSVEDAVASSAIRDAESRMRSMQTLYGQLNLSADQNRSSLVSYLSTLVPQVVNLFPAGKEVTVSVTSSSAGRNEVLDDSLSPPPTHECTMDAKRLSTVGLIVNELVTNTMKYAFPSMISSEEAGTISPAISVTVDCADGEITIVVEDNGVGLPESFDRENSSGFGMLMINAMTGQLDGTLEYESGHAKASQGTRAVLRFPSDERG